MSSIFKYLPKAYADAFISRGEVLFRSLSYFRDFEEQRVRGDPFEGARLYQPQEGLYLTKLDNKQNIKIDGGAFKSSVNTNEILIFCLSLLNKNELAHEFKADVCIEITNKAAFIAAIRAALLRRSIYRKSKLLHGPIRYYQPESHPGSVWALPEQIIMQKTTEYERQREYRIAFGPRNALNVEAVKTQITTTPSLITAPHGEHLEILLRLGSLHRICKVHSFT